MTSPVRYAIAAAAVLVVALIGYQLLPTSDVGGEKGIPPALFVGVGVAVVLVLIVVAAIKLL